MTLMPTHFFYAFLYYTDVASTTFVLAAYLVSCPGLWCCYPSIGRCSTILHRLFLGEAHTSSLQLLMSCMPKGSAAPGDDE